MKVYAEFIEEDGLQFRTKTLLQFGNSWDLIGSIVMKNPGSAKPGNKLDIQNEKEISKFYKKDINFKNWSLSNDDATMRDIAPIFDGSYVDKKIELNGIIQIYNLFNICEANIEIAVIKASNNKSEFLLPETETVIDEFKDKPVYIGYRWEYTNKENIHQPQIEIYARSIFEYVKSSKFMYLEDDIINNHFYHPQFLKIQPNVREQYLPVLNKFMSFYEKD